MLHQKRATDKNTSMPSYVLLKLFRDNEVFITLFVISMVTIQKQNIHLTFLVVVLINFIF